MFFLKSIYIPTQTSPRQDLGCNRMRSWKQATEMSFLHSVTGLPLRHGVMGCPGGLMVKAHTTCVACHTPLSLPTFPVTTLSVNK